MKQKFLYFQYDNGIAVAVSIAVNECFVYLSKYFLQGYRMTLDQADIIKPHNTFVYPCLNYNYSNTN